MTVKHTRREKKASEVLPPDEFDEEDEEEEGSSDQEEEDLDGGQKKDADEKVDSKPALSNWDKVKRAVQAANNDSDDDSRERFDESSAGNSSASASEDRSDEESGNGSGNDMDALRQLSAPQDSPKGKSPKKVKIFAVGALVHGMRTFEGEDEENWYPGTVTAVHKNPQTGEVEYDLFYEGFDESEAHEKGKKASEVLPPDEFEGSDGSDGNQTIESEASSSNGSHSSLDSSALGKKENRDSIRSSVTSNASDGSMAFF